jgi:type I restriction enzyme S subunit
MRGWREVAPRDAKDPFHLPSGWNWTTLDLLSARIHYGYTASADHSRRVIRLLRITDIQGDRVNWESVPGCAIPDSEVAKYLLGEGDILIARTGGTMGKSFIVVDMPVRAVFASYLIRVKPSSDAYGHYIKLFLDSSFYWRQLSAASRGTGQPNVNAKTLGALRIPLAPWREQHRIVAKVDELMAVCDELEAALTSARVARGRLLESLLDEVLVGALVPELMGA